MLMMLKRVFRRGSFQHRGSATEESLMLISGFADFDDSFWLC